VAVVLVEQPYRVLGRRSPVPAPRLDDAWIAVLADLRAAELAELPVIVGGRSSGARVACRTAAATGAAGVLCLAFPLVAPRGASRQEELDAPDVPVLVVQGDRDRFGVPEPAPPGREVVVVRGDHALRADGPRVAEAVMTWLARVLPAVPAIG
jgi:predicted alpha/beta-hydrolase family hydrolase